MSTQLSNTAQVSAGTRREAAPAAEAQKVVLPPAVTYTTEKGKTESVRPQSDGSYDVQGKNGGSVDISGSEGSAVRVRVRDSNGVSIRGRGGADVDLTVQSSHDLGTIRTGTGNDTVTVENSTFRPSNETHIRTEGGNDRVVVRDTHAAHKNVPDHLRISTGSGNDTVHIDSSQSQVGVSTGSGDDKVTADATHRVVVHPGSGRNTIHTNETETFVRTESVNPNNDIKVRNPGGANDGGPSQTISGGDGEFYVPPKGEKTAQGEQAANPGERAQVQK